MHSANRLSIDDEFATADFGDTRLSRRLRKLVVSLARRPCDSFPEASGGVPALEATYRFLGNSKVTPDKILAPHIEATVTRACESGERILVAHDTTALILSGKSRAEIGWVNQGGIGFLAHFSLAISRSQTPRPLGVVGITPFFRKGEAKGLSPARAKKDRSSRNESIRWWNSIEASQNLFPTGVDPIHVADREADDYDLFSRLLDQKFRFVIRIRQNRADCQIPGETDKKKLFELFSGLKVVCQREVEISQRKNGGFPSKRKDRQPRGARVAKLHITATPIVIPRPKFQYCDLPISLAMNCIHVYEVDVPDGIEPVDWKLITTEQIETPDEVLTIVDDYRARWIIEEYFKALKTGCAYEKRQLETKISLVNALAVFAPIAWQLLLLKTLSRTDPDRPATEVITKVQIQILQAVCTKFTDDILTVNQATLRIAALGGHIPSNGPPGWLILARGMETLLTMEVAWTAARERCVES